jgi:AcrR family transcriptional regulator
VEKRVARGTGTRQALIEAALEVFVRRGFARATTREIAREAGVAEGTIYRHFDDKYVLFSEVLFSLLARTEQDLGRFRELAGTGTLHGNLAQLFAMVTTLQEKLSPLMASMWADQELAARVAARGRQLAPLGFVPPGPVTLVAEYIRAEQEYGRVRADVDPLAASAVVVSVPLAAGMTASLAAAPAAEVEFPQPEAFPAPASDALDILTRGLTAEGHGPAPGRSETAGAGEDG